MKESGHCVPKTTPRESLLVQHTRTLRHQKGTEGTMIIAFYTYMYHIRSPVCIQWVSWRLALPPWKLWGSSPCPGCRWCGSPCSASRSQRCFLAIEGGSRPCWWQCSQLSCSLPEFEGSSESQCCGPHRAAGGIETDSSWRDGRGEPCRELWRRKWTQNTMELKNLENAEILKFRVSYRRCLIQWLALTCCISHTHSSQEHCSNEYD